MTERTALVVDDVPANREFLERLLTTAHFTVTGFGSGKAALSAIGDMDELTLAMVDMKLPDMHGLEVTTALRQRFPDALIVIATMYDAYSLMEEAFSKGCNVFLVKPHGFMELFKRLTTAEMSELRTTQCLVIDQYGPRVFKPTAAR
jgi:two-component system chemotaxis response regulator CheY